MCLLLPVLRLSYRSVCPQLLDEQNVQNCDKATRKAGRTIRSQRAIGFSAAFGRLCVAILVLSAANYLRAATVAPASLSWASVSVGSKGGPKPVTLTNNGATAIAINSIAISGSNAADFLIYTNTCGASLAASSSCAATILFAPTTTGTRTASLTFTDDAGTQSVGVTGLGTSPSGTVSVSPTSLSWGSFAVGANGGSKVATLQNGSAASISISSVSVTGANVADFAISSKTCGTTLASGASCTATISFSPEASGVRSASLQFSDGGSNSPQTVALSGTGTSGTSGTGSVSPSSLNWVSVAVGQAGGPKPLTLTNNGASPITISSIVVGGTNVADFLISSKTCGASLAAGASCSATIVFKPTLAGARSANVAFSDGASNSPQIVGVTGLGTGGSTTLTISPLNPTVSLNGTITFSASAAVTWAASCGTIDSSGLFTAPATAGSCTVTATATGGSGQTASTLVTVSNPGSLTVTPSNAAVHALGTQQFTANKSVTWSTSCGTISGSGLFTAPTTTGTCNITATLAGGSTTASASAVVTLVNYTTRKNTNSATGVQANELALTPASVSSGKFSQRWSATMDGGVWGQPLYMNAITVGGKARNVLYVTTSNDSVYALDADTGAQLWKKSFLSTGVTPVLGSMVGISTTTGVLSTPVIDAGKKMLYVVATTAENGATYFPHRLHALDLTTGNEMLGGPELISHPNLEPIHKFQRPSLLLANGMIYVGFGAIKDIRPYHGLLFSFDENTLEQKAVFDVVPTGSQAGIWMSGAAPSSDSSGNIYISTGNGTVSTNNFGESIVKMSPTLQVLDYFIPFDYNDLNTDDLDFGAGNVMVVPDQQGPIPRLLIACGKSTPIYVMNRDSMGRLGTSSDNIVQRLDHQLGNSGNWRDSGRACFNEPAMWQQNVYFAANHDVLKMFVLDAATGKLSATPVSKGTYTYLWPGADPVVSSNGGTNGIVWTVDYATSTLHANDATDVSKVLYASPSLGTVVRWVPPTVANGHVYVALQGKVIAFALTP
jgi:PQQ-like domain